MQHHHLYCQFKAQPRQVHISTVISALVILHFSVGRVFLVSNVVWGMDTFTLICSISIALHRLKFVFYSIGYHFVMNLMCTCRTLDYMWTKLCLMQYCELLNMSILLKLITCKIIHNSTVLVNRLEPGKASISIRYFKGLHYYISI